MENTTGSWKLSESDEQTDNHSLLHSYIYIPHSYIHTRKLNFLFSTWMPFSSFHTYIYITTPWNKPESIENLPRNLNMHIFNVYDTDTMERVFLTPPILLSHEILVGGPKCNKLEFSKKKRKWLLQKLFLVKNGSNIIYNQWESGSPCAESYQVTALNTCTFWSTW